LVIIVFAGVAALATLFIVSQVLMKHTAPTSPIAAITFQPGKARAAVSVANNASAKLNAAGSTPAAPNGPTTTDTAPAVGAKSAPSSPTRHSGPQPNATRNPFLL
jgi:hypothetical protein